MTAITVLFHTNDLWAKHRILWSGYYVTPNISLFADPYSHYITGLHASTLSGYGGVSTNLTRLVLASGLLATADYITGSGVPYEVDGPTTFVVGGKIAHYLNEWGEALGTAYIEIPYLAIDSTPKGQIHYYEGYPERAIGWDVASGIGYWMNDIVGLDYPESPRIVISTNETAPPSHGIVVIDVDVVSGMAYGIQTPSILVDLPSGIAVTDLEAHQVL